jgi:hypothetical protein
MLRFEERMRRHLSANPDGCWIWPGAVNKEGYGRVARRMNGRWIGSAHLLAYLLSYGEPVSGYEIDHLCCNRRCFNPRHLEAVPPRTNALRSRSPAAKNAQKTHCIHGHEFTPENTRVTIHPKYGTRLRACRACERASNLRLRRARGVKPKETATHCAKGHPFTPETTIWRSSKKRRCRICDREYRARWARENRRRNAPVLHTPTP